MSFIISDILSSYPPRVEVFNPIRKDPKAKIRVEISSESWSSEAVVERLAAINSPVTLYCWYEGIKGLSERCAVFMKEHIFDPLYKQKQDVELCLYSLRAWNFKQIANGRAVSKSLGEAINRVNGVSKCVFSSSFFEFCKQCSTGSIYELVNKELLKKHWLFELSKGRQKQGVKVAQLVGENSLLNCIKEWDVTFAYSAMQWIEGYWLIRESVRKELDKGQERIEIAFALPNDEGGYYADYPTEIPKMIEADFGEALVGKEINVNFYFFKYGNTKVSRPYIDKAKKAKMVRPEDVSRYLPHVTTQTSLKSRQLKLNTQSPSSRFLRDQIHNFYNYEAVR